MREDIRGCSPQRPATTTSRTLPPSTTRHDHLPHSPSRNDPPRPPHALSLPQRPATTTSRTLPPPPRPATTTSLTRLPPTTRHDHLTHSPSPNDLLPHSPSPQRPIGATRERLRLPQQVSWIRRRDLHVLTSGVHTFASDQRFLALHADRSENWTLHIRFSQVRDSGEYQCQVNTDPRISMLFYLNVQEAATMMDGSDQRYVRAGSTIQLSCSTSIASQPPGLLYWYRDAEILQDGGRVDISTHLENETVSKLVIQGARVGDSGNYTCWPTKFLPASVMVHVIPEAKAAAKSHGTGNNGGSASTTKTTNASACTALPAGLPLLLLLLLLLLAWETEALLVSRASPDWLFGNLARRRLPGR
nr:neural cell adhesion molecule 2-like [Procambarus clarkii]